MTDFTSIPLAHSKNQNRFYNIKFTSGMCSKSSHREFRCRKYRWFHLILGGQDP
jgi:hypothetical protein